MPPEWTPTPEFSPAGLDLMMPPSYEGGDPEALVAPGGLLDPAVDLRTEFPDRELHGLSGGSS
jgi:hypothetical protein